MGGEIYSSPVRYRIREEVKNKKGNISLSCQLKNREEVRNGRGNISPSCKLKRQRENQEWKEKYISLSCQFKKAESKLGMGGEIQYIPPSPVSY
jgi:hypothetical protein